MNPEQTLREPRLLPIAGEQSGTNLPAYYFPLGLFQ